MVTDNLERDRGFSSTERPLPPITQLSVASMILIVIGGIYVAAYLPHVPPLGLPFGLLAISVLLLLTNIVSLWRLHDFAWDTFFLVGRWTLLAYIVIAGMLEYIFVTDGTRGGVLVLLSLMLVMYAVDIPLILAFSVARYQALDR